MPRFQDIPMFTRNASYMVHIGLDYLPAQYTRFIVEYGLDVSPDFQRGYVWRPEQKVRFMEYMLRGGTSGLDLYMNCPTWKTGAFGKEYPDAWFVLVDGKQRLDAALGFLNNEFPVFGDNYFRDYSDRPRITQSNFRWHVNDLATREECLQWYLDLNTGGTVHTEDELTKVRDLIANKAPYERPGREVLHANAGMGRAIFEDEIRRIAEEQERFRQARLNPPPPPKPVKKARRR